GCTSLAAMPVASQTWSKDTQPAMNPSPSKLSIIRLMRGPHFHEPSGAEAPKSEPAHGRRNRPVTGERSSLLASGNSGRGILVSLRGVKHIFPPVRDLRGPAKRPLRDERNAGLRRGGVLWLILEGIWFGSRLPGLAFVLGNRGLRWLTSRSAGQRDAP